MAHQEDKNDSTGDANPSNPLPSSRTEERKSPDFIASMTKTLIPMTVDGVKHSLNSPLQAHSHMASYLFSTRTNKLPVTPPVQQKEL